MTPSLGIRRTLAALLVVAAGCSGPEVEDRSTPVAAIERPGRLETLPPIDLGRVEGALRTRIEALRADLGDESDAEPASHGRQWGELGTLLHVCEQLEAAQAAYKNAARLDSEDERWPYYLGMIHQTRGDLPEALAAFEQTLQLAPDNLAARLRLGEIQLLSSRLDDAQGSFEQVLALAPQNAAARYGLGRLAAIRGASDQAVADFEAVLALEPRATEVHYPLALAYRKLGDESRSRKHLALRGDGAVRFSDPLAERLSETKTRNAFIVISALAADVETLGDEDLFGFALEQIAPVEGAAAELRRLIDGGPPAAALGSESRWRARMHYLVGGLEARSGADAAAAVQFRAALTLEPQLVDAARRLGNALARLGQTGEAVEAYSRVLEIAAWDRDALLRRATALLELGRLDEAGRDLEMLTAADPSDGMAHSRLGVVRARSGDSPGARSAFERALAADLPATERSLAHRQLANLWIGSGVSDALDRALPHLRAVVALEPERAAPRLDLAGVLARLGRYREALGEYERALALEPEHPRAQVDRARILIRLGRDAEAREFLEAARVRWPDRAEPALALARLLASSPDSAVRDGNRALTLAEALFRAEQTPDHAEVLAMALAEAGRFDQAVALQERLLRDASDRDPALRQRLAETLARYRNGLGARRR